jgi:hypothetical protein
MSWQMKGGDDTMAGETQPTNERIIKLLEVISKQLSELRDAQKKMATELSRVTQAGR